MLGQPLDAGDVAHRLALLGAPADSIDPVGADLDDIIVAEVEAVEKHPDADRLFLCKVNTGSEVLDVVCGAPNVKAGCRYPYAPVGAVLPGDFKIKKRKIRGVESLGMLCSASELGLGTDSEGIMELDVDCANGERFSEAVGLADTILDLDITPDRPDLLCHKGVARELGAALDVAFKLVPIPGARACTFTPVRSEREGTVGGVKIVLDDPEGCPRYMAAAIKGVRVGSSPEWLQQRLRAIGARPVNNVVDATNYILFELNQPMHAFDLQRLDGKVLIRKASKGEKLVTLDGQERNLDPSMTMICDATKPIAIAGVMGGTDSEIGDETTDVLLECAYFSPASTRSTRNAVKLSTDASYRFERGTDPDGMADALRRAVSLIIAVAGGEEVGVPVDIYPNPRQPVTIFLRPDRVEKLLGVSFAVEEIERFLVRIGFVVAPRDERLAVQVPGWRPDVTREVDLIEEIARLHGFDEFPTVMRPFRPSSVPSDPVEGLKDRLRSAFTAAGLHEARSLSLGPAGGDNAQPVLNPLSSEEAFLRTGIMDGLLRSVERNWAVRERNVRLFEIGAVFEKTDGMPSETLSLAALVTGHSRPAHWSSGTGTQDYDLWDLKMLLETALDLVGGTLRQDGNEWVVLDESGAPIGRAGRQQADAPAWAAPVYGFEMRVSQRPHVHVHYAPVPKNPPVERDLALVLPAGVSAAEVEEVIRKSTGSLLESVVIFDEYRADDLAGRSVAWRIVLRSPKKTLRDKDADQAMSRTVKTLRETLGVELR